jgi:hypothetical protein
MHYTCANYGLVQLAVAIPKPWRATLHLLTKK